MEASLESGAKSGKVGKKKAARAPKVKRKLRLRDARVGTMLLWVMAFFAVLIAAVGGLAAFFLQHNYESIREVNALTERAKQVDVINSDMLRARVSLMVAARHLQESGWGSGENSARDAAAALKGATDLLTGVRSRFADFQKNMLQDDTGRQLSMNLVRRYRSYIDDGVDTMVEALRSEDYSTFYMVNNEYGTPRSAAFIEAIGEFSKYIADQQEATIQQAEDNFNRAMVAVAVAVALALALMVFCRVLFGRLVVRPLVEAGQHFDKIAAGDLTSRVEVRSHNEIGQLFAALKRMQESLTRTVATVRRGVDEITVGSREISAGNTDLSSRTEEQAASLEETAASMEELASTVKQNADNARQANQLAASASDVAERGGSAVAEVVNTMQGISASSRKISEIVSVIDGIAFQTNILALNAAVEAARAGEQGKGFAVVAGEVRSLAQRSAQAAKEIKGLIEDSVTKVGAGSQQVERAGATMQEIVASVKRVTDIMGEISAASEEQSSGIDQVNRAVSQMDEVTQQNAALVEEAAAAAGSLQEQAHRLAEAVAVFKINAGEVIEVPAQQLGGYQAPTLTQD
ncbi:MULTISPECIES: methyl-accepting chemotaxis protein [Achromobacter]|jgi:methyl-accepting chemotaxis protein I, serine sensor receptor|uniref:Methyl-accepting chemotaxis protein II n=21 Tax=Achromobacter TaxID=222 RepID=A0A6S7ESK1_9BURK|nr:methyl-accepting chemotaxis protein [Achromobacter ruhlandii]AKP90911.1 Aerotaxis sensor receptor protein [Achromobacter xylosoxidans]ALX83855.1 chemotaxis protein [Achromobacter denitrificans]AOU94123.1 methyl-accepting chemotaxis protein [Achromobacter ruhlandii]MCV6804481.1 methyl-accepting chemotaxis protein [Achromobacter ruhlandii]MCZ8436407.1 methyl-accepting chemotaxis protein [Achromobacter ruhlandii]